MSHIAPEPSKGAALLGLDPGTLLCLVPGFGSGVLEPWRYDLASGRWSQDRPQGDCVPRSRRMFASFVRGSEVVVFAGRHDDGRFSQDLLSYDTVARRWRRHDVPVPVDARYCFGACGLDGGVAFFGGAGDGGLYNDVWLLGPELTFERLYAGLPPGGKGGQDSAEGAPAAPSRRYGASMVAVGRKLAVFGGYTSRVDLNSLRRMFNDVWLFDVDSRSWELLSPDLGVNDVDQAARRGLPAGRYCAQACEHGGRLHVFFGSTGGVNGFGLHMLGDSFRLDLAAPGRGWSQNALRVENLGGAADLGAGLKFTSAARVGHGMYFWGGESNKGLTNALFRVDLDGMADQD